MFAWLFPKSIQHSATLPLSTLKKSLREGKSISILVNHKGHLIQSQASLMGHPETANVAFVRNHLYYWTEQA